MQFDKNKRGQKLKKVKSRIIYENLLINLRTYGRKKVVNFLHVIIPAHPADDKTVYQPTWSYITLPYLYISLTINNALLTFHYYFNIKFIY